MCPGHRIDVFKDQVKLFPESTVGGAEGFAGTS